MIIFYVLCLLYVLSTATVVRLCDLLSAIFDIYIEVSNRDSSNCNLKNMFFYQLLRMRYHFSLKLTCCQWYFAFRLSRNLTTSSLMGKIQVDKCYWQIVCSFDSITSYIVWERLSLPRHTQVHSLPKFKEPKRDMVYNYAVRPLNVPAIFSMSLHGIV